MRPLPLRPLPLRQREVLQLAVRHYIDTVEPVGSRTLVRRFGLAASPATVRSALGALEQRGLLTQPHTSAGRIPSQEGYRLFVDQLLPAPGAGALQLQRELIDLSLQWAALDDLLLQLSRRLADLTGLLSLITRPQRPEAPMQALRLVPSGDRLLVFVVGGSAATSHLNLSLAGHRLAEVAALERWLGNQLQRPGGQIEWASLPIELDRTGAQLCQALQAHSEAEQRHGAGAVATGLAGLLAQPEFSQTASLRPLVELVEDAPQQLLQEEEICIGAEHPHQAMRQCAVVQASYRSGDGGRGQVALIGPMRMAYATAQAAVHSVAKVLERLLG